MSFLRKFPTVALALVAGLALGGVGAARADSVTDWNVKAAEFVAESKLGTPPAIRVMAIVQTAVYEAVADVSRAKPPSPVAIDAAVAAAHRATLVKLLPAQAASVESATQAALAALPEEVAKNAGIAAGEKAAASVLARRLDDGAASPDDFRPHTTAGAYVPTASPAAVSWPKRKPWNLASAAQFRPAPPPALSSAAWARDYDEVKAMGGRTSAKRSAGETEVARFWEFSLPAIYHGIVRSVANAPGRDPLANARLFAAVAQAMDDGMIAVLDAKYHYRFWRPVTAIRNGDLDGNDATGLEATWSPLIDTPMHPEYPSAHSVLAAAVGAVIVSDLGDRPLPVLATSSPTAKGATRRWTTVDAFVQEVGDARVWAGIHYRFSTDTGRALGKQVGERSAQALLPPAP